MGTKPCRCGSGHNRFELRDAAGIFCTFVCDACEDKVKRTYNPAIFESRSAYAHTGEEADIDGGYEPYENY